MNWTADYPQGYPGPRCLLLAGYTLSGWRRRFRRHDRLFLSLRGNGAGTTFTSGLSRWAEGWSYAQRDPLGKRATAPFVTMHYSLHSQRLGERVTDAVGLQTKAEYNYRVLQPRKKSPIRMAMRRASNFTPLGLPKDTFISPGQDGQRRRPAATPASRWKMISFPKGKAFTKRGEPVYVRTLRQLHHDTEIDVPLSQRDETIETREYSDGFGRLIQTRNQGEALRFADLSFCGGNTVIQPLSPMGPEERFRNTESPDLDKSPCRGQRLADLRQLREGGREIEPFFFRRAGATC